MKLCRDCRYYVAKSGATWDECLHPDAQRIEPVRGESRASDCASVRMFGGKCGPEAALFADRSGISRLATWAQGADEPNGAKRASVET